LIKKTSRSHNFNESNILTTSLTLRDVALLKTTCFEIPTYVDRLVIYESTCISSSKNNYQQIPRFVLVILISQQFNWRRKMVMASDAYSPNRVVYCIFE